MLTNHSLYTQITHHLKQIYGPDYKEDYTDQMENLLQKWKKKDHVPSKRLSEKNVYLITYGDSIQEEGEAPLSVLHRFLKEEAHEIIKDVHLLPMFPYTSGDGFSVVDYREVNPDLGSWDDIAEFSQDFRLMFDFVANHMSKSSPWFQRFLEEDPKFAGYFIEKDESFDTSQATRPLS
nr:alpha-amylase family glycosyl hydrolase [Atopococcus tabaci]